MSATASTQVLTSIRTVGGLLPADMLLRIADGKDVPGSAPADYHVVGVRSVKDSAERRWDFLKGAWRSLRDKIGSGPDVTGVAVKNWLLPLFEEHGFGWLGPDRQWRNVPFRLAGWDQDLDSRPAPGELPPQSSLQIFLNQDDDCLWGVLSNGRQLRFLRDSSSFASSAYIEVDLEAMFDGELFDEFILLYRLLHVSRFEVPEGAPPSSCWLEKWRIEAIDSGARFLDNLRPAVKEALEHLGTGFLRHPANGSLRDGVDVYLYKRALLRLVYRLLFWFVTEDRDVLLSPAASEIERSRYAAYFSSARLRTSALRRTGTPHVDLWAAVRLVLDALGKEDGLPRLGLVGLGGIYDDTGTDQILRGLELSNEYLLKAVRSLARVRDESAKRWRRVDYRNLGAEELGSIYESLLELDPKFEDRSFVLRDVLGNEQKMTGSYYTPTSLIDCLLDSALDPVLDDAVKRAEVAATSSSADVSEAVAEALLSITVCDPACGSGHFLVAAARRIAKRVAAVREHNPEPTIEALRSALRDVVARCIYGVDMNAMAVELAKVSLWLEAVEPGKPLTFLDAHIKCGNALLGTTPVLIDGGIPDGAFKAVEGDDTRFAASLARANAMPVQDELFSDEFIFSQSNEQLAAALARITDAPAGTLRQVHRQADAYHAWEESAEHRQSVLVANAWCAAFMWVKDPKAPPAIVNRVFRALREQGSVGIPPATLTEITRLAAEYNFFHWHLEFPDIFRVVDGADPSASSATGWSGGFSCVLANPPWDEVGWEDKKYFSAVEPSIAALAGQRRRVRIEEWQLENTDEGERYRAARRTVKSTFLFFGKSGAYPLCAKGLTAPGVTSLMTDQLFAEKFAEIAAPIGRVGCIIPTAIATGAGGQYLFRGFTDRGAVRSLYDFENRKPLFHGVDSRYRFCLLALTGRELGEPVIRFAFFLTDTPELENADRTFTLTPEDIALLNPNTHTLPVFRTRRDAGITTDIYRHIPVLWDETKRDGNPWDIAFKTTFFHMTDDADLFRSREKLVADGWYLDGNVFVRDGKRMLPLYEAKMVDFFNHRAADVVKSATAVNRQNQPRYLATAELHDPDRFAMPLSWIADEGLIPTRRKGGDVRVSGVTERLTEMEWHRSWLCGWCDVTSATNERTSIPVFIPRAAVGHTFPLMLPGTPPLLIAGLVAAQSSFAFDFVSRQKTGGTHMNLFVWKQLPVPAPPALEPYTSFITPRVLELVYAAYDIEPLARDLGDDGTPFTWDEERRAQIRAELDAFFFRLYGVERDDVDYIMETFPIVKEKDVAKHGSYRTKETILGFYDRMESADATGVPYETTISPAPGQGPRHVSTDPGGV